MDAFGKDVSLAVIASVFASIGFENNNIPQLIGAMVVSPLANPIIRAMNKGDIFTNFIEMLLLVSVCIVIGIVYFETRLGDKFKPTALMLTSKKKKSYVSDILYATLAGVCIYLTYGTAHPEDIITLTGVAIGITVLPPIVNAGLMIGAKKYDIVRSSLYLSSIYFLFITLGYAISMSYFKNTNL